MADELLPVTQADRDAAAGWIAKSPYDVVKAEAEMIRLGHLDGQGLVQAFARHRLSTDAEVLRGALDGYAYDELWGAIAAATRVEAGIVAISVVKFRDAIRTLEAAISPTIDSADDHIAGDGKMVGEAQA